MTIYIYIYISHYCIRTLMFMQVVMRYKSICIEQNTRMPLPTAGSIGGVY